MSFSGADAAELDSTARLFTQAADRLEAVSKEIHGRLSAQVWTGPDADRFRGTWSYNSAAIRAAATILRDAATTLGRNASEQHQASRASTGSLAGSPSGTCQQAPSNTAALYDRLRHVTATATNGGDGVFVEQVQGTDDVMRAIVYLGGTESLVGTNQPFWSNIPDLAGQVKQWQIDEINRKMKALNLPANTPMMLAGYSQGGMDAQLLAQSGKLHGQVAAVVTYGSPIVSNPNAGYQTVHLQDAGDVVPKFTQPLPAVENALHGNIFTGTSSGDVAVLAAGVVGGPVGAALSGLGVHGDLGTYEQVGNQFDSESGYERQKAAIRAFQGDVIPG